MIVLLDTSTPECRLTLADQTGDARHEYTWQANRDLADGLLQFLVEKLAEHGAQIGGIYGIGVFAGPGSFTGLRIGMTVLNTIAVDCHVPIVTAKGEDWQHVALERLKKGDNDKIALPFYGREANITQPKK